MNHSTVGVYANGEYVINIVVEENLENHIQYNLTFRPGRAFFVDGKCRNNGYLSPDKVKEWEGKIKEMNINLGQDSAPYQ